MIQPDVLRNHTKKILTINGPEKKFNARGGEREKYVVIFEDGYTAEYCPLTSSPLRLPKPGQSWTFKIRHRGNHGDEIESIIQDTPAQNNGVDAAPIPTAPITNMNGHPATTAINIAMRYVEMKHAVATKTGQDGLIMADVLENADIVLDWLKLRAQE